MNSIKSKYNISGVIIIAIISFIILAFGSITGKTLINAVGLAVLFVFLVLLKTDNAMLLLTIMTPNSMIVCLPNPEIRVLGFMYLLVYAKLIIEKKEHLKLKHLILGVLILAICVLKIPNFGVRDLLTCFQTIIVIFYWIALLSKRNVRFNIKTYDCFVIGTVLMSIGMILNKVITGESRTRALLDDANYTAVVFSVLFAVSLLFLIFKVDVKKNLIILGYSALMGATTGSRAFLLSIGLVLVCYFILGLRHKIVRKIFFFALALVGVFFILYAIKIPIAVNFFDMTIGRTFALMNNYNSGQFMDVTSGRLFLWEYYLDQLFSQRNRVLFGLGFSSYYFVENGGYGLVAHNTFVSGLMGFGVLGLFTILILYFNILSFGQNYKRNKLIYITSLTILVAFLIGYFFLDGLLDIRMSMYLGIYVCVQRYCLVRKGYMFARKNGQILFYKNKAITSLVHVINNSQKKLTQ